MTIPFDNVVSHFGTVAFSSGAYSRVAGSTNWTVAPILGFDPPIRLPLGMVQIRFAEPATGPYVVLVTAQRAANSPLVAANYANQDENGFVVHLWETVADRTVQNAGFSFAVLQSPKATADASVDTLATDGWTAAVAPNSVRVWRGYALDRAHLDAFYQTLGNTFIPITAQVMSKLGLTAYLPAIVPHDPTPAVPDEIALVFYRSQPDYRRSASETTVGRAYQKLHAGVFNFSTDRSALPASASDFPTLLENECAFGRPYHLFAQEADWYQGESDVFVGVFEGDEQQLAQAVLRSAKALQMTHVPALNGLILLVIGNVLIYWRHWQRAVSAPPWEIGLTLREVLSAKAQIVDVEPSEYAEFRGVDAKAGQFLNVHFQRK